MDHDPRPLFARTLSGRQLVALDALAAIGYTLVAAPIAVAAGGSGLPGWACWLIIAAVGLPVAVRRRWPLTVFGVVFALSLPSVLWGVVSDPFLAAAFALYTVASAGPAPPRDPTRVIAALSLLGALAVTLAGPQGGSSVPTLMLGAVLMGAAWTIGRAVRERRGYAARSAAGLAERAVTEERLRIAREMHDVVAHNLSLIAVKAGVANHVAGQRPAEARDALRVIEATSRDALTELRQMLGVLRTRADAAERPPVPAVGVEGLPVLAEHAALAGVRVDLDVHGVDGLAQGVALSVYRIVQEALTNVIKHAAPAHCRIVVDGRGDQVRIEVTDDGPGTRMLPGEQGHGLIGMRERAVMHGGRFTAGARPDGGFAVSALLPRDASGVPS